MSKSDPHVSSDSPSPASSVESDQSLQHLSRRVTSGTPSQAIHSVLQGLFAAELLDPGPDLWMALPRIWNASVLDNRANAFHHLEPTWPQSEVRLLDVLEKIMQEGASVRVMAGDNCKNETFAGEFRNLEAARSQGEYRAVSNWDSIESGVVASSFCIRGALQFSQHGLSVTGGEARIYAENRAIEDYMRTFEEQWLSS